MPLFFREIEPKPGKHTMWTISHDFTDRQAASKYRCVTFNHFFFFQFSQLLCFWKTNEHSREYHLFSQKHSNKRNREKKIERIFSPQIDMIQYLALHVNISHKLDTYST